MIMRIVFASVVLAISVGCSQHELKPLTPPKLNSYAQAAIKAGVKDSTLYYGAWEDFNRASDYCRSIHNNYERGSKNAEAGKLAVGFTGGVAGVIGSMLAAAGTGGYVGGIAAGLAGVTSTVLGSSEKGPLGTSFYTTHKEGIARQIQAAADKVETEKDPQVIASMAGSLRASCLAADTVPDK